MKTLCHVLAFLVVLGASAHAQTVSPIPTPTIITTAPYTISTPGYYQLGANLTVTNTTGSIIAIQASNVTLDFAGHYISGPVNTATQLAGVSANEQGNLVIQNGTIAFCETGIFLTGNGQSNSLNINQTVQNMLVSYCYTIGIQFNNTFNSAILNNRISFIGGTAFQSNIDAIIDYDSTGDRAVGNTVTNVSATSTFYAGGIVGGTGSGLGSLVASGNEVSNVSNSSNASYAFGIYATGVALNNIVNNCYLGIYSNKYANNITTSCTTPFQSGGTALGYNN